MIAYNKTLRWAEPYDGWDFNSNDTGLCNRILHWEVAYEINKKNNFEYKILLEKLHWPELDLLWLPHTAEIINYEHFAGVKFDRRYQKLQFTTVFDTEKFEVRKASEINFDKVKHMFMMENFVLEGDNHWYSNFGYMEIVYLYEKIINEQRPLSHIRLRHNFIEDFLRRNTHDVVGIHMRRDVGVYYNETDLSSLSYDNRNYILDRPDKHISSRELKYVSDEKYFQIIDRILKTHPTQKFYISTDLPIEFISHIKSKYPGLILTREDFIPVIKDYIVNTSLKYDTINVNNSVLNVIDLFSLSFCKMLIRTDNSTWSEFAALYRGQPHVSVNDNVDLIYALYENPDWGQPGDYKFNNFDYYHKKLLVNCQI